MSGCCDPNGCRDMFGEGFARRVARQYRRRGLDPAAQRMVDFLAGGADRAGGAGGADLAGLSVLEIGGGVGEIGLELLRRGASTATNLEITDTYDAEAARLAAEAGVGGRVRRRVLDVATDASDVEPADLVVLHRVVCCYPDAPRLLRAAADLCQQRLAFTHPRRNRLVRAMASTQHAAFSLRGKDFRFFVHDPQELLDVVARRGLQPVVVREGRFWQVEALARGAA